jgi:hypothetical protein
VQERTETTTTTTTTASLGLVPNNNGRQKRQRL